jgi:hypothetical protein
MIKGIINYASGWSIIFCLILMIMSAIHHETGKTHLEERDPWGATAKIFFRILWIGVYIIMSYTFQAK